MKQHVTFETILAVPEVQRSIRDISPTSYLLKIKSFAALCESEIEKLESDEFEAGGYKWRLCLYPKGNKDRNGSNHISLYLATSGTASLPECWEVNVQFKFFVYHHINDNYLTFEDEKIRRFHALKTEWGFDQFLSKDTFENPSNGYLFEDSCVFGAEVFVIKKAGIGRRFDIQKLTTDNTWTWEIKNISTTKEESFSSNNFKIGDVNWKLLVYPKGNPSGNAHGKGISIYLGLNNYSGRVYAEYKLGIRSQVDPSDSIKVKFAKWFYHSLISYGSHIIMSLSNLNDKSKGYIVNDILFVEVEITILAITKNIN